MTVLLILSCICLILTLWTNVALVIGVTKMGRLKDIQPFNRKEIPKVSIIVAACNEEHTITDGLLSLVRQSYENLEIIAVDDRSTDNTWQVMKKLQQSHSRLRIHRIKKLPDGWLGKSHALQYGAGQATGEYLIFTDADVQMEETTVARALSYVLDNTVDHLALFFRNVAPGWLLNSMILDAGANLLSILKPWKVGEPQSNAFVGVGAFNMVRSQVYHAVGGHSSIRMHPVDDIMLGKIIKKSGFSQHCLIGIEFITVRWYESVREMVDGLMKNVFSLFHYRIVAVAVSAAVTIFITIVPLWGFLLSSGYPKTLFLLAVLIRLFSFLYGATVFQLSSLCSFGSFIAPYLGLYISVKAAVITLRNGGITWRGTHYPLAELRKSQPLLF